MATLEQLESALRNADAAGDTEAATALATAYKAARAAPYSNEGHNRPLVNPDADKGTASRYAAGVSGALDTMRVGLNDAVKRVFPKQEQRIPTEVRAGMDQSMQASRNASEQYEQTKDQLGTAGMLGDWTPELVATAAPIARGGAAIARAPVLARTLGKLAPAVGDVAANAIFSGAKSAGQGHDWQDVAQDAGLGAAGAAGGRVLVRTLAGAKPLISESARKLVDRGVLPTPGQLFDGPIGSGLRSMEDKAMSVPGVGDVIGYARRRAVGDFNRASIDDAVAGLGKGKVSGAGSDAIEQAQRKVSASFDEGLDGMAIKPKDVVKMFDNIHEEIPHYPMIDEAQVRRIDDFIATRIDPLTRKGAPIDGETAKRIDAEIGHHARKYSRSINPSDHSMGEALYGIQGQWRSLMEKGASGDRYELVKAANTAHKNLLPLIKASDKAMAQGGVFSPNQLQRSYAPYNQRQNSLTAAAQEVLPGRVPDSGTAGRLLLAGAVGGGAAVSGPAATAALLSSMLYTKAGLGVFLNGMGGLLPQASKDYLAKLPPAALQREIARMHAKFPHLREGITNTLQQMASQGGRAMAQPDRIEVRGTAADLEPAQ